MPTAPELKELKIEVPLMTSVRLALLDKIAPPDINKKLRGQVIRITQFDDNFINKGKDIIDETCGELMRFYWAMVLMYLGCLIISLTASLFLNGMKYIAMISRQLYSKR